jgi:hypothetical protein
MLFQLCSVVEARVLKLAGRVMPIIQWGRVERDGSGALNGWKGGVAALKHERVGNKIEDILRGNSIESEISGILPGPHFSALQLRGNRSESDSCVGEWPKRHNWRFSFCACDRRIINDWNSIWVKGDLFPPSYAWNNSGHDKNKGKKFLRNVDIKFVPL